MQTDKNKSRESEISMPIGINFLSSIKFELYSFGSLSSLSEVEFSKLFLEKIIYFVFFTYQNVKTFQIIFLLIQSIVNFIVGLQKVIRSYFLQVFFYQIIQSILF